MAAGYGESELTDVAVAAEDVPWVPNGQGLAFELDDDGTLVQQDDLHARRRLYLEHCREHGIEPRALQA